jgi:hypothetical protein
MDRDALMTGEEGREGKGKMGRGEEEREREK